MIDKFLENLYYCLTKAEPANNYIYDLDGAMDQAFILTYKQLPFRFHPIHAVSEGIEKTNILLKILNTFEHSSILKNLKNKSSEKINTEKSFNNICEKFPNTKRISISVSYEILINENFIINTSDTILLKDTNIPKGLVECFVEKEQSEDPNIYLVTKGNYGFDKNSFKLNAKDIENNYNDDLPYDKIQNFIRKENESGIILLNSVPGMGKSYFIRHLVDTNKDLQFLYLDSSVFNYINDSSFINFLINNKNSIVILEDCEAILKSRDSDYNNLLSSLLNMSDGLLGDSLNLKFICTFNTNLTNIDKALLRKGRLKVKYEFNLLSKDKVEKIFEKLGIDKSYAKPMTLAEVYNFEEENGVKQKKKIGF